MRALVSSVVFAVLGCSLPSNVRYRCETDGGCALKEQVCASDLHCHPLSDLLEDGGLASADGGECVPRDVTEACAVAECGYINDGCKDVKCLRTCPSGPQECGVNEPNRCGMPKLCTGDGWCWENPYPQGYTINAGWRGDERHVWWVGENRLLLFNDGQRSSLPPIPQPPELAREASFEAIHGTSNDNIFVVGTQGSILRWNGQRWEKESGNSLTANFMRSVAALPDGGALIGANQGQVLLRVAAVGDPKLRWMQEALPSTADVRDVLIGPDQRMLALTRSRELYAKNAPGWELIGRIEGINETYSALAWDGGVLVGGFGGTGLTYLPAGADGLDGGWVTVDAGFGVTDLVEGEGGVLINANGNLAWLDESLSILRMAPNWNNGAVALMPMGTKKAFVGGANGFMAEVDLALNPQSAITFRSSPIVRRNQSNNGICGQGEDRLFVAGNHDPNTSSLPRWAERTLSPIGIEWKQREQQLSATTSLLNCFAEADRVFLLGNDGKFFTLKPGGVVEAGDFTNGTGGNYWGLYNAAWGSPDVGYFFTKSGGSSAGEVTYSDAGLTGTFGISPVTASTGLWGIWGLGTDVFAVGDNGSVVYFDVAQRTFADQTNGSRTFRRIHGAVLPDGARRFVAASNGGVGVWEQPGGVGTWAPSVEPVLDQNQNFGSAWVSSSGAAWVGGTAPDGGAFVARQGGPAQPWLEVPNYSPRAVNGLWGVDLPDGGTSIWVVGPRNAILRHD